MVGSEPVDLHLTDRRGAYDFVTRTLRRLNYAGMTKADKGVVRCFVAKVTGLSRAQSTRLIGQYRNTGVGGFVKAVEHETPLLPGRLRPDDRRNSQGGPRRVDAVGIRPSVRLRAPGVGDVWGRDDHPHPEPVAMPAVQ